VIDYAEIVKESGALNRIEKILGEVNDEGRRRIVRTLSRKHGKREFRNGSRYKRLAELLAKHPEASNKQIAVWLYGKDTPYTRHRVASMKHQLGA